MSDLLPHEEVLNEFDEYSRELATLLVQKHQDYGISVAYFDVTGIAVRLFDKVQRIKNILLKNGETANEPFEDTFLDIAGYGLLGYMIINKSKVFYTEDGELRVPEFGNETLKKFMTSFDESLQRLKSQNEGGDE